MPETRMDAGSSAFSMLLKLVMMFGWQIQSSESGGCGMHMRSKVFVRYIRCAVYLVIRRRVSSLLCVVQKKRLWGLWSHAHGLVRPQYAAGSRSVQRRQPRLSRVRSESPRVWWRLQPLRKWSHEQIKQIFPRSTRARSTYGAGAPWRVSLAMGGH